MEKTAPRSRKFKKKDLEQRLISSVEVLLSNGNGKLKKELSKIAKDHKTTPRKVREILLEKRRRKRNRRRKKRRSDHHFAGNHHFSPQPTT